MFIPIQDKFGVKSIRYSEHEMMAALYLQVSIVSQALIFVTRSRSWSYVERPGLLLLGAFIAAQLVRTYLMCCSCHHMLVFGASIVSDSENRYLTCFIKHG